MEDEKNEEYPPPPIPQAQPGLGIPVDSRDYAEQMPMYDQTMKQLAQTGSVEVSALAHRPTVTEMLQHKRNMIAKELEYLDKALAEAKANPGTMDVLDALAKAQVGRPY